MVCDIHGDNIILITWIDAEDFLNCMSAREKLIGSDPQAAGIDGVFVVEVDKEQSYD